jgi:hypothetical protein
MAECLLDTLPARTGGTICWRHHDEIARMLDPAYRGDPGAERPASIVVMLGMLNPAPGSGTTGRRVPGYQSSPSAALHKVVMLDDRSQVGSPSTWYLPGPDGRDDPTRPVTEDEEVPRAVRKALVALAESLAERLGVPYLDVDAEDLHGPRPTSDRYFTSLTVTRAVTWLHTNVLRLTEQPDADWIYDDLLELSDQLRPAIGDQRERPTGKCMELVKDRVRGSYRECGCLLYMPPPTRDPEDQTPKQAQQAVVVTCRRCRRNYTWLDLIRLHAAESA